MTHDDRSLKQQDLREALATLRREDAGLAATPSVEERVMRAWDSGHGRMASRSRPLRVMSGALALAASLLVAIAAGYWWMQRPAERLTVQSQVPDETGSLSYDALAWLDPDPASLHIVRLRVQSATLESQGYPVTDPDGDGEVEIEMVVGMDGVARTMRVAETTGSAY